MVRHFAEAGTIATENPKPSSPSGSYALPAQAVRNGNRPMTASLPTDLVPGSDSLSQFESSHLPNGTILWHIHPSSFAATSAVYTDTSGQHTRRTSATNVNNLVKSANGWVPARGSQSPTNIERPAAVVTVQTSPPKQQRNGLVAATSSSHVGLIDTVYFAYLKQTEKKDQNGGDTEGAKEMESPDGSTESSNIPASGSGSTESLDAPTASTTVDSSGSSSSTTTVVPRRRSKSSQEKASIRGPTKKRQYQEECTGGNDVAASH
jgi:hypothetical protein